VKTIEAYRSNQTPVSRAKANRSPALPVRRPCATSPRLTAPSLPSLPRCCGRAAAAYPTRHSSSQPPDTAGREALYREPIEQIEAIQPLLARLAGAATPCCSSRPPARRAAAPHLVPRVMRYTVLPFVLGQRTLPWVTECRGAFWSFVFRFYFFFPKNGLN
jgi:hypothetical protein